ncbi:ATPase-like protein [Gloeothece citriformis PCC 7424]|uniref:ATPase-like protein n=1 Tax=Gloeothece citriformis (strain PCC 7424) TaxID=65393 RepID=B7K9A8_GLOC7|nr:ATP-binding protein [Gloeothece citriformis]ACK68591.1 ATPase-like protein [Gloeothece citriformis PCC 7424]
MFTKITLRNYRTHKLTTIELQPVTLLIGNNNSGKSNLLAGIQHFSDLVKRGDPEREEGDRVVSYEDFFPHQYRFAAHDDPMSIEVESNQNQVHIKYRMELYREGLNVGCRERISVDLKAESKKEIFESGYDKNSNVIALQNNLKNSSIKNQIFTIICQRFFKRFVEVFSYHFQSSFLKEKITKNKNFLPQENLVNSIPKVLGYEGENFQRLIVYIKEKTPNIFSQFIALMRRFERSFIGVRYDPHYKQLLWEFEANKNNTDDSVFAFVPDVVSDGFMKAAAIGLLVCLPFPPALILIEEIENGINPGNIQELMRWIWQATSSTQFILTSHSPSVLREFHNHLNAVYTVRLNKRTYQSDVRNLNDALDVLIGIGTLEGEIIEDKETGKRLIEIPQYKLAELWYSGVIG